MRMDELSRSQQQQQQHWYTCDAYIALRYVCGLAGGGRPSSSQHYIFIFTVGYVGVRS
jgi:hypothetical protein